MQVRRARRVLLTLLVAMVAGELLPATVVNGRGKLALFVGFMMGVLVSVCIVAIFEAEKES